MGGKPSTHITENDISNEINTEITNNTQNITSVLNETINTTTTEIVNESAASIQQSTGGLNMFTGGDLSVGGSSQFNMNQNLSVAATNTAIMNLVSNTDSLSKLGANLSAAVTNAVQNDSKASTAVSSNQQLQDQAQQQGGLAGVASAAFGALQSMMKDLTGNETDDQMRNRIKTKMNMKIENTTLNESELKNLVQNTISNNIKNVNTQTCQMQTSGNNIMSFGNIKIDGKANVSLNQSQAVAALNNCIISTINTNKLAEEIQTVGSSDTGSTTKNTNSANSSAQTEQTLSKEVQAAPTTIFTYIGGFILVIILLGFAYRMFSNRQNADTGTADGGEEYATNDVPEQGGGGFKILQSYREFGYCR